MKKILHSCLLCLKYPFLYPRSKTNGLHYNNKKFHDYIYGTPYIFKTSHAELNCTEEGLYQKGFKYVFKDKNDYEGELKVKNVYYAILYWICNFIYEYPMQLIHCIPKETYWDFIDEFPGWKKSIGSQYLEDLKKQLIKDGILYSWRILEIGEKNSALVIRCNYGTTELYKLINKYEIISYNTCMY